MSAGPLGPLMGMTFDPIKNRYFPTPPAAVTSNSSSANHQKSLGKDRRVKKVTSDSRRRKIEAAGPPTADASLSTSGAQRAGSRRHHGYLPARLAWKIGDFATHRSLLRNERYLAVNECEVVGDRQQGSEITAMHAVPGSSRRIMTGNVQGEVMGFSDQVNPRNIGPFRVGDGLRRYQWRSFNFASSISGVHCEKDYFLATSFGPKPVLVVCPEYPPSFSSTQRYAEQSQRSTIMYNLKGLKEARCMSCKGGSVSIGGDGKILYSNQFEHARGKFEVLPIKGKSDIMAIEQVNTVEAYAGLRSGGIYHFDFRIPGGLTTVFDPPPNKMPAINLVTLESVYGGGRALLVNRMNSQLALFDLRFPGGHAAVNYEGHVNETFEPSMAVSVDQAQATIFAAGTDHRIRAWNVTTGESISAARAPTTSLLGKQFAKPISALLSQDDGSIYVATATEISVFAKDPISWD